MNIEYKGTRWFKCDFHLHTTASQCFQDKTVTAEQWVDRAIEQGLDCVAITDHNTNAGIDDIKLEADRKELIVFPAVEITCSDSKVHLLILFDLDKTSNDIRDFLVRANIRADEFGKEEAISNKSIMDITDLADNDGAIVIPAHIDDYNGLKDIGNAILRRIYQKDNINSVQVVNNPNCNTTNLIRYAKNENLALLTFSDNPHAEGNSKHGLWGMGQDYSWIKMDEKPSLESLRQAFLLPEFRVKNKFESIDKPYTMPNIWIKSISIKNTTIADDLKVDFNPQLNTIIGGRGTGKSSILRCIRGVFNRTSDIQSLNDIFSDHTNFYQTLNNRNRKGILKIDSEIEIEITRENILHKVIASSIQTSSSQVIEIKKYNEETKNWEIIEDIGYIDFLEFEQYSQKQIYEIAQEPNALRERIDNTIEDMNNIESEKKYIKNLFFQKSAEIRTIEQQISNKEIIQTKISDLKRRIERFQESGITKLLIKKEKFEQEKKAIENFEREITQKESLLSSLIDDFTILDIDYSEFDEVNIESLQSVSNVVIESINNIKIELERLKEKVVTTKNIYNQSINESNWKESFDAIINDFNIKKEELAKNGIDDFANFEALTEEKNTLENQLQEINSQVEQRTNNLREKNQLQSEYFNKIKKITQKRREFIGNILNREDLVKIEIKPFRDKNDFESKLREIIQREDRFEDDIKKLKDLCFRGNVEQKIKEVRKIFFKIKKDEDTNDTFSGYFKNLVKGLNDEQLDEIELLMPEDEIEVQYKITKNSQWKPLSTASAGQKTTAILTFILSHGDIPLILDQPEDDLDNRLVYDLIVDRLKKAKEKRQLIVVTHNANIPVNGDAEYIISMDTESEKLKVRNEGTVEKSSIKKEICDVMEGSEKAFQMRSKRYVGIGD